MENALDCEMQNSYEPDIKPGLILKDLSYNDIDYIVFAGCTDIVLQKRRHKGFLLKNSKKLWNMEAFGFYSSALWWADFELRHCKDIYGLDEESYKKNIKQHPLRLLKRWL